MMTRLSHNMRIKSSDNPRSAVAVLICCILFLTLLSAVAQGQAVAPPPDRGLKPILDYISSAWDTLTRSMTDCASVVDPKIKVAPVLYLPKEFAEPAAVQKLAADCNGRVEHLPIDIHRLGEIDTGHVKPHGLLYLPDKYVVPGGRFNEMYVWGRQFLHRGPLRTGK